MARRVAAALVIVLTAVAVGRIWMERDTSDQRTVPAVGADARADLAISDADVARYASVIERSTSYVEGLFQRSFATKPKIRLFATRTSFRDGLSGLFDYSEGAATAVASHYGGIFDPATATIALSLEALAADGIAPTIEHELTHLMAREATAARPLPAWFEEGMATLAERRPEAAGRWAEQDAILGRAVAATRRVSFAQTETLDGWHAIYPRVGQALYAYAARAVGLMRSRLEWAGVLEVLASVSTGQSLAVAYQRKSGETIAALEGRLASTDPEIITRRLASGDAEWTLFTGAPLAPVTVTIAGASTYVVSFTVTADDLGMYRGTFGSTAPPGLYTLSAAGARAQITTRDR